jgi:hypothetical protein
VPASGGCEAEWRREGGVRGGEQQSGGGMSEEWGVDVGCKIIAIMLFISCTKVRARSRARGGE